ncbi:o-succinylbenzoate synthase [Cytobacillus solani]|uniref:o-succinylbenzoate synthase n=1 Tax=Cytobacillus solani TaxID=1637975 RepID=A0A0Q3VJG1_9BACI|nr:o-succinylbenzoate synthase [Cytobacillus solani]KOP71930.1 O-succinylbenzoate synthase [Bacillus sp. FJAT-21945]KQL21411.1 o-succinylbenzoate synthase [Cytobacillus solani]USK54709.1 o-succinylbenzoate synthase [Cytobacillus solani]
MKIDKVKLERLKMPLLSPFETSFGTETEKEYILVSVYGDGHVGYAESVAMESPAYNEETIDTVWHVAEQFIIPQILKAELESPADFSKLFSWIRRNNMAKSAIEGALWDLYAKQNGISLSKALGGEKEEIEVGVSIGIEPTVEGLLKKVEGFLAEGYKKIKVKIKPGIDVDRIKAIRETFGYEVPLMADANSAYTLDDIDTLKELDQYGLIMIEQPLAHDDIVDHAKLQRELQTPICLDESIHSVEDARKAIELGSCKIINIKVGRVGGLTEAKKIHDLCQSHGIPVWCGGMLEAGVGRAHNIAIASLSNFIIPGDTSASKRYWAEDIVEPEVTLSKPGTVAVPKEAGIGYSLVQGKVDKYLIDAKVYR